uniref:Uncharacterized protein n=1 Tax=Steinernema glaseri TaxID=37863 RepID=A0A1I7YBQ3_9BILA
MTISNRVEGAGVEGNE